MKTEKSKAPCVLRVKIQICFHDFFLDFSNEERYTVVHLPLMLTEIYFFDISMDI